MKFDRKLFFDNFKTFYLRNTGRNITARQVAAVDFLLTEFEKQTVIKRISEISYCLGTTSLETAWTYEPIEEYGGRAYYIRLYWTNQKKAHDLGNLSAQDAVDFDGKGDVQLTGRTNYKKATVEIKKQMPLLVSEFEARTGETFDLVASPNQAKDKQIAFAVMVLGMSQGWFTGKKLANYFSDIKSDKYNARRIINGIDHAANIASVSDQIENILKVSAVPTDNPATIPQPNEQGEAALQSSQPPEVLETGENSVEGQGNQNAEESANESKPPIDDQQTLTKESPSTFTKIGATATAAIGTITSFGINLSSIIQNKIDSLSTAQIVYGVLGIALIALAIWWYDRSAQRANRLNQQKLAIAADRNSITTELVK